MGWSERIGAGSTSDLGDDAGLTLAFEGFLAGGHLIQDCAGREDIGPRMPERRF